MDLNLVVLAGRLAAPPEVRQFASGATLVRYLVTVRSDHPRRRVDVLPVSVWGESTPVAAAAVGDRLWVAASLQRRFWDGDEGRRSRLEIVAAHLEMQPNEELAETTEQ